MWALAWYLFSLSQLLVLFQTEAVLSVWDLKWWAWSKSTKHAFGVVSHEIWQLSVTTAWPGQSWLIPWVHFLNSVYILRQGSQKGPHLMHGILCSTHLFHLICAPQQHTCTHLKSEKARDGGARAEQLHMAWNTCQCKSRQCQNGKVSAAPQPWSWPDVPLLPGWGRFIKGWQPPGLASTLKSFILFTFTDAQFKLNLKANPVSLTQWLNLIHL